MPLPGISTNESPCFERASTFYPLDKPFMLHVNSTSQASIADFYYEIAVVDPG
jgi:hypothetical protein